MTTAWRTCEQLLNLWLTSTPDGPITVTFVDKAFSHTPRLTYTQPQREAAE